MWNSNLILLLVRHNILLPRPRLLIIILLLIYTPYFNNNNNTMVEACRGGAGGFIRPLAGPVIRKSVIKNIPKVVRTKIQNIKVVRGITNRNSGYRRFGKIEKTGRAGIGAEKLRRVTSKESKVKKLGSSEMKQIDTDHLKFGDDAVNALKKNFGRRTGRNNKDRNKNRMDMTELGVGLAAAGVGGGLGYYLVTGYLADEVVEQVSDNPIFEELSIMLNAKNYSYNDIVNYMKEHKIDGKMVFIKQVVSPIPAELKNVEPMEKNVRVWFSYLMELLYKQNYTTNEQRMEFLKQHGIEQQMIDSYHLGEILEKNKNALEEEEEEKREEEKIKKENELSNDGNDDEKMRQSKLDAELTEEIVNERFSYGSSILFHETLPIYKTTVSYPDQLVINGISKFRDEENSDFNDHMNKGDNVVMELNIVNGNETWKIDLSEQTGDIVITPNEVKISVIVIYQADVLDGVDRYKRLSVIDVFSYGNNFNNEEEKEDETTVE